MENTPTRSRSELRWYRLEKKRERRRTRVLTLSATGLQLLAIAAVMATLLAASQFVAPAGGPAGGVEEVTTAGPGSSPESGQSDANSTRTGHWAPPDSNGYVPEYYGVVGNCYDGVLGRDTWYTDRAAWYGPYVHYIQFDVCEMRRLGATDAGWARLKAHERAHSRGFGHWEGSPSYNAAFYPSVQVR